MFVVNIYVLFFDVVMVVFMVVCSVFILDFKLINFYFLFNFFVCVLFCVSMFIYLLYFFVVNFIFFNVFKNFGLFYLVGIYLSNESVRLLGLMKSVLIFLIDVIFLVLEIVLGVLIWIMVRIVLLVSEMYWCVVSLDVMVEKDDFCFCMFIGGNFDYLIMF